MDWIYAINLPQFLRQFHFRDIVDILIVFVIVYEILKLVRGTRAVQMLYGIQRAEQERLASDGCTSIVLVAYGSYWYPWFVRRLAERPANLWFMLRNVFAA